MENINTPEISSVNIFQRNKLPVIGFILMLLGPGILMLAGFLTSTLGYAPVIIANIIAWTVIILPGIGAVMSIISLVRWKKTGKLGRALTIVTVVMCNPIFYFYYFIICVIASSTLAGLSWM